ncbi:zinc ribbon domain-containing protein [Nocardia sp. IBHARD005]|uniref:zinc ribbon domain-containing protein n=1 Tax=Nocardia sp. IBHARD005 TaxID=3457765 RepID=UPI0040598C4B
MFFYGESYVPWSGRCVLPPGISAWKEGRSGLAGRGGGEVLRADRRWRVKVTRIAYSRSLNDGKYGQLQEQARRLGVVRSLVWRQFGSIQGLAWSDRQIRDVWIVDGTAQSFGVLANAWKETVRDAVADITANREAAKVKARRAINRRTNNDTERKRLYTALNRGTWDRDSYLTRLMRRHWRHGRNKTTNQIVVRADQYKTFTVAEGGNLWLAVPGLERRQLVRIPLNTTVAPTGTLRPILRGNRVEVHYQINAETMKSSNRPVGNRTLGVDKGYTEVLTKTFAGRKKLGKNTNRRLAAWAKGVTAEALQAVSDRRGSAVRLVNAAYTSQVVPFTNILGVRKGDRLHCTECRAVWQADHAAAINIRERGGDPGISLHTKHTLVKQILQERTDRQRTRLPVQDSSTSLCGCGERNIRMLISEQ